MTDLFLKLTGLPGDSTDAQHPHEIALASFSWGETSPGTYGAPGEMSFAAETSSASPALFLACAKQTPIAGAILTARTAGPQPFTYLQIWFGLLHVASYAVGSAGSGASPATDQFSIAPTRMKIQFTPQRPDGTPAPLVQAGWDFLKHISL